MHAGRTAQADLPDALHLRRQAHSGAGRTPLLVCNRRPKCLSRVWSARAHMHALTCFDVRRPLTWLLFSLPATIAQMSRQVIKKLCVFQVSLQLVLIAHDALATVWGFRRICCLLLPLFLRCRVCKHRHVLGHRIFLLPGRTSPVHGVLEVFLVTLILPVKREQSCL